MGKSMNEKVSKIFDVSTEDTGKQIIISLSTTGGKAMTSSDDLTIDSAEETGLFQGYKNVVITAAKPVSETPYGFLSEGRVIMGGNIKTKGGDFSVSAVFTKNEEPEAAVLNAVEEDLTFSGVVISADNSTLELKSTGSLYTNTGRVIDAETGKDTTVAGVVLGYKDVTNSNSWVRTAVGGKIKFYSDGDLVFQDIDDGYYTKNELTADGSFTATAGSRTDIVTGYKDVSVDGASEVGSVMGGKSKEEFEIFSYLNVDRTALTLLAKDGVMSSKASGTFDLSGKGSKAEQVSGFKDVKVTDSGKISMLNSGNLSRDIAVVSLDAQRGKDDNDRRWVKGAVTVDGGNSVDSVGKATLENAVINVMAGSKNITASNKTVIQAINGGRNSQTVNMTLDFQEEGLDEKKAQRLEDKLLELIDDFKNGDLDLALSVFADGLSNFLNNGKVTLAGDVSADIKAIGKASFDNSTFGIMTGVKNVTVSNGSTAGFAIGGKAGIDITDIQVSSEREVNEEAGTKTVTVQKTAKDKALNLNSSLQSTGSFKANDSSVRCVAGYKNLTVNNNTRTVGGEGQKDQGIAYYGGDVTLTLTGHPFEEENTKLLFTGSEKREDGKEFYPVRATGKIDGSVSAALKATGSVTINGGAAPSEGEAKLYSDMTVINFKNATINGNDCNALLAGGNLTIGAKEVRLWADNNGEGGAFEDLRDTSKPMFERIAAFLGNNVTAGLNIEGGNFSLESTGKAIITDSIMDKVVGYKTVRIEYTDINDMALGGNLTGTDLNLSVEAILGAGTLTPTLMELSFNGTLEAAGSFYADDANVGDIIAFKKVTLKDVAVNGGYITNVIDYQGMKAAAYADAKGTVLNADLVSFKNDGDFESGICNVSKITLKNASGDLAEITTTGYNDTVKIGTTAGKDLAVGEVDLGAGNDTFQILDGASVNISGLMNFGGGKDTLKIGKDAEVVLKADKDSVSSLNKFTIGKNAVVYLSSELIDKGKALSKNFAKDATFYDIGEFDVAKNFTDYLDEISDNLDARELHLSDADYNGWLDDTLDTIDNLICEEAMTLVLGDSFEYSLDGGKTWLSADSVNLKSKTKVAVQLAADEKEASSYIAKKTQIA